MCKTRFDMAQIWRSRISKSSIQTHTEYLATGEAYLTKKHGGHIHDNHGVTAAAWVTYSPVFHFRFSLSYRHKPLLPLNG